MRRLGWETRNRRREIKRPWLLANLVFVLLAILLQGLVRFAGLHADGWSEFVEVGVILTALAAIFAPIQEKIDWYLAIVLVLILLGLGLLALATSALWALPFPRMDFTGAWRPSVGAYPILWPGVWLLLAISASLAARRVLHGVPALIAAGLLVAGAVIGIEPAMTGKLHYWHWAEPGPLPGGAPITYGLGWFLMAAAAAAVIHRWLREEHIDDPAPVLVLLGYVAMRAAVLV